MAGPKKKQQAYQWSGDVSRIIPLAQGTRARITDEFGKSHTFARDSVEYQAEVERLDALMDGKITRELQQLGWI